MLKSVLVRFVGSENRQEQQVAAHKILTVDGDDESKVIKVCAEWTDTLKDVR
jgi:hydroxymethylglutaryl-CoA reductase